ncbi:ArtA-dependent S-layer glycoprotein [Haloferax namakaokahaiae]|uniref:ArtA-dependent S-layer glycoprotein n=1 Tax=Haloferax namakaokahaiae TaxID=1748331 RepID=A0ABD5ZFZ8_9EURY
MKGNKQIRAVLLAALMVMSVFAGSIAFSGSAAADAEGVTLASSSVEAGPSASVGVTSVAETDGTANDYYVWVDVNGDGVYNTSEPLVSSADPTNFANELDVSDLSTGTYNVSALNSSSTLSGGEVADFNASDALTITSASNPSFLSAIHYQNGTDEADAEFEIAFSENVTVNDINVSNGDGDDFTSTTDVTNGRVLIEVNDVYTDDFEVEYNVSDDSGNTVTGTKDVTFAPVFVNGTNNATAYKGSVVAVVSNSTNSDVEVNAVDDDNSYQFDGSTGTASKVFLFKTSNRDLGEYEFTFDGQTSSVDVRDLGLDVTVDELNVTDEDDVTGTVTANAGGRTVDVVVLDEDDEEVASDSVTLNGQGEGDFNVETLDAGEYTIEVTDVLSGVTVSSDTVTVTKAADSSADFETSVVTEQVGDIAEVTVSLTGTSTANVTIGSDDVGYTAEVEVSDEDDDGEVVLLFNTYQPNVAGSFTADGDDEVTDTNITTEVPSGDLLDAGDYDLEVATGGDADNVGTLVLEERSTDSQAIWTAPTGTDVADAADVYDAIENGNVTESSEIANGDIVVHQISATGLEGAFEAESFDDLAGTQFNITVEQTNPGPNRKAKVLGINSTSATVIADGENDTYFVVYDLDDVSASRTDFYSNASGVTQLSVADGDSFNATFTVLEDGDLTEEEDGESVSADFDVVEPEISLDNDEITVNAAAGQTISGTATVAPGTALTFRVRSSGDTQPRFLKTGTAYVQADGTFSATFDFSEQAVDDTFDVTVSVDSGDAADATAEGTVGQVEETTTEATETTTEEPTETTTEATTEATEEPTEETTEATEEPTEEPTEEETSTGTPGFGIAVALVALVAAALLAVRRD